MAISDWDAPYQRRAKNKARVMGVRMAITIRLVPAPKGLKPPKGPVRVTCNGP